MNANRALAQTIRKAAIGVLAATLGCQTIPTPRASTRTAAAPDISFEERLLARFPPEHEERVGGGWNDFLFSVDGRSAAYVVQVVGQGGDQPKCFVMVNGRREPEVARVGAHRGMCGFCGQGIPVFSPDSRRFGYAFRVGTNEEGREGVSVDGKTGPLFDDVSDPIFSRDSSRHAYEAVEKEKKIVVVDHRPLGMEFDGADHPVFSPRGDRVAYRGWFDLPNIKGENEDEDEDRPHQRYYIVLDGVRGEEYDFVGWPIFSPDGQKMAFEAQRGKEMFMIVGDARGESFDYVGSPAFSPDGRRLAYAASSGERFILIIDGRRTGPDFESMKDPFFSPDSKRVACIAIRKAENRYKNLPPLGGKECLVVDGVPGEDCDMVHDPVFSANSRHFGYTMSQDDKWFVVVDGTKFGHEFSYSDGPAFSPDGRRFAFVAEKGGEGFIVCGDQRSESFDVVRSPVFSPDGKKIAFGAKKGNELWWKVMEVK